MAAPNTYTALDFDDNERTMLSTEWSQYTDKDIDIINRHWQLEKRYREDAAEGLVDGFEEKDMREIVGVWEYQPRDGRKYKSRRRKPDERTMSDLLRDFLCKGRGCMRIKRLVDEVMG